jgi:IS5 family transposase
VIERSRCPVPSGGGPIAEDVAALWEGWMRQVDDLLADEQLVELVYEALAHRWTHSRTLGRRGTPADVVLRLLVLKHVRNWSYGVLEREVRANLVYRQFTHVGAGKVPDAKTLGRIGLALGPAVVPPSPALAHWMRRTDQPAQAPARAQPLSLQRRGRHEALGRTGGDRR